MAERFSEPGSAPAAVELFRVLHAVGREVADFGQLARDLQENLSPLAEAMARDNRTIEALQVLDLLAQGLHGVAAFLGALAPTLPATWVGDAAVAAQVVTLSDLARRLGCPGLNARPMEGGEADALELFEVPGE